MCSLVFRSSVLFLPVRWSCLSTNVEIKPILTNRNPRNLEKLRIAHKPKGWHLEKPGRSYWHKLDLETTLRYVTAKINHFENGLVISASTQEWPIKKQLYRYNDIAAYINLGHVLAQRCLEFGISEVYCNISQEENPEGRVSLFLKALQSNGLRLEEAPQYIKPRPVDLHRPEKPWEVYE